MQDWKFSSLDQIRYPSISLGIEHDQDYIPDLLAGQLRAASVETLKQLILGGLTAFTLYYLDVDLRSAVIISRLALPMNAVPDSSSSHFLPSIEGKYLVFLRVSEGNSFAIFVL